MKNIIPVAALALLTLVLVAASIRSAEFNTLSPGEIAAGWQLLFDGHSLTGWHVYGSTDSSTNGWNVENETIFRPKTTGRPSGGDLVTDRKFRDFEFSFEWRIGAGGNSGIHYLVDEHRVKTSFKMYAGDTGNSPIGLEYQLLDDERHPDARNGPIRMTASIYSLVAPTGKTLHPVGEFNESRIVLDGNHIEHWLNGSKVAECELNSDAFKAAIAKSKFKDVPNFAAKIDTPLVLQDHGEEIAFRNLKIRELNAANKTAKPADGRFSVPNAAQQTDAEKLIRDVFKSEFAGESPELKSALARKLRAQGLDTHDTAAERYMLLQDAVVLGVQAGDVDEALKAGDDLARLFDVNPVASKLDLLTHLGGSVTAPESAAALARACVAFFESQNAAENFDAAVIAIPAAEAAVRRLNDPPLAAQVQTACRQMREMQSECAKARQAQAALAQNAYDTNANFVLGRYLCFLRGNWDTGLPHLSRGTDPALQSIAEKEAAKPKAADAQMELADAWFEAAKNEKNNSQIFNAMRSRAAHWYELANGTISGGLMKLKAEKRLQELKSLETPGAAPARHGNRIDLLALIDVEKDTVGGEWHRANGGLTCTSGPAERIEIPYRPPQEYDFKITFTCSAGLAQVCQILSANEHAFSWIMGSSRGQFFGIETIAGQNASNNPTTIKQKQCLETGRQYVSMVEVRKDRVRAFLDGKLMAEWKTDYHDMSLVAHWSLRDNAAIGFGSYNTATTVLGAEVIEVTGKGTITRP